MSGSNQRLTLPQKNYYIAEKYLPADKSHEYHDLVNSGQYDKAHVYLEQKFKIIEEEVEPRNARDFLLAFLLWNQGTVYQLQGRYDAALDVYKKAIHFTPHDSELLYTGGLVAYKLGDFKLAGNWWNDAIMWLSERAKNGEQIFTTITQACEKAIEDGNRESMMPIVLANYYIEYAVPPFEEEDPDHKRYKAVLNWGLLAQTLDSKNLWCDYVIGRAYRRMGEHEKAIPHLQKFLKAMPNVQMQIALLNSQLITKTQPAEFEMLKGDPIGFRYYNAGVYVDDDLLPLVQKGSSEYKKLLNLQLQYYRECIRLYEEYFEKDLGSGWNNEPHMYAMCLYNVSILTGDDDPATAQALRLKALDYSRFAELESAIMDYDAEQGHYEDYIDQIEAFEKNYKELLEADQNEDDDLDFTNRFIKYAEALRNTNQIERAFTTIQNVQAMFDLFTPERQREYEKEYLRISTIIREQLLCLLSQNKIADADKVLKAAIEKYPYAETTMSMNYGYDRYTQTDEVEPSLKLYNRAEELIRSKKNEISEEVLYLTFINRANLYVDQELVEQALQDYKTSYSIRPSLYATKKVADCYFALQDFPHAYYWYMVVKAGAKHLDEEMDEEAAQRLTDFEEGDDVIPVIEKIPDWE